MGWQLRDAPGEDLIRCRGVELWLGVVLGRAPIAPIPTRAEVFIEDLLRLGIAERIEDSTDVVP